jgi:hypothetical protein
MISVHASSCVQMISIHLISQHLSSPAHDDCFSEKLRRQGTSEIMATLSIREGRNRGHAQQAPSPADSPPKTPKSPELAPPFHQESVSIGCQSRNPKLNGKTRPRRCVPTKLTNVPVRTPAREHAVPQPNLDVVGRTVLHRFLDLDGTRSLVQKRLHESASCVVHLYFAGVERGIVGWERVWTEADQTLATSWILLQGKLKKTHRMAMFGKLWTKVPRYACAPRFSFHCCSSVEPLAPMTSIGVKN